MEPEPKVDIPDAISEESDEGSLTESEKEFVDKMLESMKSTKKIPLDMFREMAKLEI